MRQVIIIGELINGTRKSIREAIAERNAEYIAELASKQAEAGADYIDCNAGTTGEQEVEDLKWLVEIVQGAVDKPLSLDSPNPQALQAALDVYSGPTPLINSITGESERFDAVLPIVRESGAAVVALAMSDEGMPQDADQRVRVGGDLAQRLMDAGVDAERVFIDPVVVPIGTNHEAGRWVIDAIAQLRAELPACHITAGLSNVSYGLPNRRLLNRVFAVLCIGAGLDAAIVDPLDRELMAALIAAETAVGRDEWCANYLQAYRSGKLE